MSQATREELEEQLKAYVGIKIGPPELAPVAVNEAMIRTWCDAMGDSTPVYRDADAAAASVHGALVAPPAMMQAWILPGMEMSDATVERDDKQAELHRLFTANGYPGVVATNCEQAFHRYLKVGDRVSHTTTIESISEQKATGLGIGYFINTRDIFHDQNGEEVGWMTFRVLKFMPHQQPAPVEEGSGQGGAAAAPPKPLRMKAPLGHDNGWWWEEGIKADKLLIQKCSDCGELRHPPRPMCPHCHSVKFEGHESTGKGTVYSFVVMHYPKFPGYEYPFACALIDLEEGTRILSNVMGCPASEVKIGMKVQCSIEKPDGEQKLPIFRPVS